MVGRVLVSERARSAVRDVMSDTILREIDQMWQDEGFPPVTNDPAPVGGQRVTRFQGYLDQVDWTNASHVHRALDVFEVAVKPLFTDSEVSQYSQKQRERVSLLFAKDGVTVTDEGRFICDFLAPVAKSSLDALTDPRAIEEHLDRIARATVSEDPAQAIGSAKELLESTAKLVLLETGYEITGREELPELVKLAQEHLQVHPTQVKIGPDGTESVKKILGASSTIATSVAELRNAGFGTGHGGAAPRSGLGSRHARLAVNSARTWCEFILDTLADGRAPWRQGLNDR